VLTVTTRTTGPNQDPDGYLLSISGSALEETRRIGNDDSTVFTYSRSGDHELTLRDLAPGCSADGNPRTLFLSSRRSSTTRFNIVCE